MSTKLIGRETYLQTTNSKVSVISSVHIDVDFEPTSVLWGPCLSQTQETYVSN